LNKAELGQINYDRVADLIELNFIPVHCQGDDRQSIAIGI